LGPAKYSFLIYTVQMHTILLARREIAINIWTNRDDGERVLIVMIDADLAEGRMIKMSFFPIPPKPQSARSVLILQLHYRCNVNQNLKFSGPANLFEIGVVLLKHGIARSSDQTVLVHLCES
jgi:hypothetical protein